LEKNPKQNVSVSVLEKRFGFVLSFVLCSLPGFDAMPTYSDLVLESLSCTQVVAWLPEAGSACSARASEPQSMLVRNDTVCNSKLRSIDSECEARRDWKTQTRTRALRSQAFRDCLLQESTAQAKQSASTAARRIELSCTETPRRAIAGPSRIACVQIWAS